MEHVPFEIEKQLSAHECDCKGKLKISYLMRFLQEAAERQLDNHELHYETLKAQQQVFLLTKNRITIKKLPAIRDGITIKTWPGNPERVIFPRYFEVWQEDERVIEPASQWVLINPETKRVLRPKAFTGQLPTRDELTGKPVERLAPEMPLKAAGEVRVRYSDLDMNQHLNNAIYADILCDYAPLDLREREIIDLQINYLHEALYGDSIVLTAGIQGNSYYLEGTIEGKNCFVAKVETLPVCPPA